MGEKTVKDIPDYITAANRLFQDYSSVRKINPSREALVEDIKTKTINFIRKYSDKYKDDAVLIPLAYAKGYSEVYPQENPYTDDQMKEIKKLNRTIIQIGKQL